MKRIEVLADRTEILVSDEKFETLYFTPEGEKKPTKFGIVLTEEMKDAITQGWYSQVAEGHVKDTYGRSTIKRIKLIGFLVRL